MPSRDDSARATSCKLGPRQANLQKRVAQGRKKQQPRGKPAAPLGRGHVRAPQRQTDSGNIRRAMKCELCSSYWPSPSKLRRHVSQVHKEPKHATGRPGPFASLLTKKAGRFLKPEDTLLQNGTSNVTHDRVFNRVSLDAVDWETVARTVTWRQVTQFASIKPDHPGDVKLKIVLHFPFPKLIDVGSCSLGEETTYYREEGILATHVAQSYACLCTLEFAAELYFSFLLEDFNVHAAKRSVLEKYRAAIQTSEHLLGVDARALEWAMVSLPSAPKLQRIITAFVCMLREKVEETSRHLCVVDSDVIRLDGHNKVAFRNKEKNVRCVIAALGLKGYLLRVPRGVQTEAHGTLAELDAILRLRADRGLGAPEGIVVDNPKSMHNSIRKLVDTYFPGDDKCVIAGDTVHRTFDVQSALSFNHQDAWQCLSDVRYAFRRFSFVVRDAALFRANLKQLEGISAKFRSSRASLSRTKKGARATCAPRRLKVKKSDGGKGVGPRRKFAERELKWMDSFISTGTRKVMPPLLMGKLREYWNSPTPFKGSYLPAGVVHRMLTRGGQGRAANKRAVPAECFPGYQSWGEFVDELNAILSWYSRPRSHLPPRNRAVWRIDPDGNAVEANEEKTRTRGRSLQEDGVITRKVRGILTDCMAPDSMLYWFRHLELAKKINSARLQGFSIGTAAVEAFFHELRRALPFPNMVNDRWQQDVQFTSFFLRKSWSKYAAEHPRAASDGNHKTDVALDIALLATRGHLLAETRDQWQAACCRMCEKLDAGRSTAVMSGLAKKRWGRSLGVAPRA